jgi:hypothetical protein
VSPEPVQNNQYKTTSEQQEQKHLLTADVAGPPVPKLAAAASDSDGEFVRFWDAYPRKTGKVAATKAWARLKNGSRALALIDVAARNAGHGWPTDHKFIPHPATYLNGKRWADEWRTTGASPQRGARQLPAFDESKAAQVNAASLARLAGHADPNDPTAEASEQREYEQRCNEAKAKGIRPTDPRYPLPPRCAYAAGATPRTLGESF